MNNVVLMCIHRKNTVVTKDKTDGAKRKLRGCELAFFLFIAQICMTVFPIQNVSLVFVLIFPKSKIFKICKN